MGQAVELKRNRRAQTKPVRTGMVSSASTMTRLTRWDAAAHRVKGQGGETVCFLNECIKLAIRVKKNPNRTPIRYQVSCANVVH